MQSIGINLTWLIPNLSSGIKKKSLTTQVSNLINLVLESHAWCAFM
jgi:hypothetical protein